MPKVRSTIDMAREAGLFTHKEVQRELEAFANLVRADELEACARVCEKIAEGDPSDPNNEVAEYTIYGIAMECAAAIRNRGNT
jgi:hypothetical protein